MHFFSNMLRHSAINELKSGFEAFKLVVVLNEVEVFPDLAIAHTVPRQLRAGKAHEK